MFWVDHQGKYELLLLGTAARHISNYWSLGLCCQLVIGHEIFKIKLQVTIVLQRKARQNSWGQAVTISCKPMLNIGEMYKVQDLKSYQTLLFGECPESPVNGVFSAVIVGSLCHLCQMLSAGQSLSTVEMQSSQLAMTSRGPRFLSSKLANPVRNDSDSNSYLPQHHQQ